MSNREIGNLYESIRRGDLHETPTREKDLYSLVYSKPLHEATVTIDYGDGNVQTLHDVPNETARKLFKLKDMDDNAKLIADWCRSSGWDSEPAIFSLSARLNDIYNRHVQLDNAGVRAQFYDEIKRLITLQKKKTGLRNLTNLINSGSRNFSSALEELAGFGFEIILSPEAMREIGTITFEEGAVGVGPGEALLTLFTEASNPDTGDIILPDGSEIELKGAAGRPGKKGTYNCIANFLKVISDSPATQTSIDFESINNCYESIKQEYNKGDKIEASFEPGEKITTIRGRLSRMVGAIDNKKLTDFQKLGAVLSLMVDSKKQIYPYFAKFQANGANMYQFLTDQREQVRIENGKEGVTCKTFFEKATDQELISTLPQMCLNKGQGSYNITNSLTRVVPGFDGGKSGKLLLGAAIQIADYYSEQADKPKGQSFDYYVLFNKASLDVLTIGPFTNNFESNFNLALDRLMRVKDLISISPDTGGRSGWNISLGAVPEDEVE